MISRTHAVLAQKPSIIIDRIQIDLRASWKTTLDLALRARSDGAMNSQTTGLRVASLLFAVIALGHLVRLLQHAQVVVGSHTIPLWISGPLAVIALLLSFWMWKLSK